MLSALVSDQAFPTIHVCLVAARGATEGGVMREVAVVVIYVHMPANLKLSVVIKAGNLVGLCLCFAERREQ